MRVEQIIAPNGKLWSEMKQKTKKRKTSQQLRRAETLKWRAERKSQLWELRPYLGAVCGLCGMPIYGFKDAELDHKIPVRRGGDTDENTHLVHTLGNRAKGSIELSKYLEKYTPEEIKAICQGRPCPKREKA